MIDRGIVRLNDFEAVMIIIIDNGIANNSAIETILQSEFEIDIYSITKNLTIYPKALTELNLKTLEYEMGF